MSSGSTRPPQLTDWHRAGELVVYLRVSTEDQKRRNTQEYQRAQVAQLTALGFQRIRVIDQDLGKSGTTTRNRTGWQELEADIEAERVRGIAVTEVSRLGRDDLALFKFLRLCKRKNVILFENGVLRDPREISDSMLLKVQAIIAEGENERRAMRSLSGRLAKGRKGIPVAPLPCGFEFDLGPNGEAVKTADPLVREILDRVFREALENVSPRRIATRLREEGLRLPARGPKKSITWVRPTRSAVCRILGNPLYAGWVVLYRHRTVFESDRKRIRHTTLGEQEWIPGKIEAYVTPDQYRKIQDLLAARRLGNGTPRGEGEALCPGLVYCGRCNGNGTLYVAYVSARRATSHPRRNHAYICRGSQGERDCGPICMAVSGRMLDRAIEEIVLSALRLPSPATLRRVIRQENKQRQANVRLVHAQVREAQLRVTGLRAAVEESRQRGKNPAVTQLYEDELEAALQEARQAEQRAATTLAPALIDDSPAFLGELVAAFREFPRLWRSGRLGPQKRKTVVARLIQRIDILEKGETMRIRVTLRAGDVFERTLFLPAGRRRLVTTLKAEGLSPIEIAAELRRRGILNNYGCPFNPKAVKALLTGKKRPERRDPAQAFRALWEQGLPRVEIAVQMNAQGFRLRGQRLWTLETVMRFARRQGLPRRWEIHRELVRATLTELVGAKWDYRSIAEELGARGLKTYSRGPWTATIVKRLCQQLGIHR